MVPSISIIILNWNGRSDTIECVESCLLSTYPSFRIVVVDNGSSDGSEAALLEKFPYLDIVQTGCNLGYAGGNNRGIRHALANGADYVWLLNNDTVVAPDALAELVAMAEATPHSGMIGSKILFYDRPDTIWFAGGFWSPDGAHIWHRGYEEVDQGQYNLPCSPDFITGCSMLVKAEVVQQIGLLSEEFFLYWEDADWSRRALEHDWEIRYAPASKVWHKVSVAVEVRSFRQMYYFTRNACLFMERHARKRLLSHLINHQGHQLLTAFRDKDWRMVAAVGAGLRDYVLRRFGARV